MDTLILELRARIKNSASKGGSESIFQIAEHFISEGYTEEEVKTALSEIFKSQASEELDT